MKPFTASIIMGVVLIAMSLWGYLGSDNPSPTALIPGIFGLIFLGLSGPLKKENKIVAHIIVVLTVLLIISLFMPLRGVIQRDDTLGLVRIVVMFLVCLMAMSTFIQSFIKARKARS